LTRVDFSGKHDILLSSKNTSLPHLTAGAAGLKEIRRISWPEKAAKDAREAIRAIATTGRKSSERRSNGPAKAVRERRPTAAASGENA